MLQFVLGRAGSGKTEYLRRMLVDKSGKTDKLFLIVPEQYSFETEKAILRLAGPVNAAKVSVLSFSRLAETVFREEGGFAGKKLNDGGRRILMNMAIEEAAPLLEIYRNSAQNGRIADVMLHAVSEMKMCRISESQLREASKILPEGALKAKLNDIALLFNSYNALVSATYLDSQDDLSRLADILPASNFFKGAIVAVDSFEGFTAQETAVLKEIIVQAKETYISLCTDGKISGETSLFALTNRTKRKLERIAESCGVNVLPDVLLRENHRQKNPSLGELEKKIFAFAKKSDAEICEGIHIFEAGDVHAEAAYIAATIRNLVMDKAYKYRDFTIVCRAPERYQNILGVELAKRQIPCFISAPERIDAEPVMRFALGAFEAVTRSYATEEILGLLKTGVSGLSSKDISDLENYAFLWRLKSSAWRAEFTRNPRGFTDEETDADTAELRRLNALRERIIKPLEKFAAKSRGATGRGISEALYEMLMDFDIEENIHKYCKKLEDSGEASLAAKQIRIWDLLIEILEQMADVLGEKRTGRERYYNLMRDVVRSEDISEIPQVLDEVLFGTPEQVRQSKPGVVFLLGAVQGEFPLIPRNSGVFSDYERRVLINDFSLPLGDSLEQKTIEERYLAYSAAVLPSHELYVTYPKKLPSGDCEPSEIIDSIRDIFGDSLQADKPLSVEKKGNSWEAAFSEMAARYKSRNEESESLKVLFEEMPDFSGRKQALARAADSEESRIKDEGLSKDLFGNEPRLSASQIETYHKCKFRYFCEYGLRARERKPATIDVQQYGTVMHYLFEQIFQPDSPYQKLEDMSDEELMMTIASLIEEYANISMGGYEHLDAREKYRLKRMTQAAVLLIRHVSEELAQSRFKPEFMELKLGENTMFPPLKVKTEGGGATIIGTVDRVDFFDSSNGKYVRVIDYKTGAKKFNLLDVLYGLNMQMLVYLAALISSGNLLPAGILYVPSASPSVAAEREGGEGDIKNTADKELRMNGIVLENDEIIRAMDSAANGKYIPASVTKTGAVSAKSSTLSAEELSYVLDYSKRLIATMVNTLHGGDISAEPNLVNTSACKYCSYAAACGKEFTEKDVQNIKAERAEIFFQMGMPQKESMMGGDSFAAVD